MLILRFGSIFACLLYKKPLMKGRACMHSYVRAVMYFRICDN